MYATFESNFGIKCLFAKYLKESCERDVHKHYSSKYFTKYTVIRKISSISEAILTAVLCERVTKYVISKYCVFVVALLVPPLYISYTLQFI